ncbi:MAG: GtrA family protein [Roseateles asaccharophilus]|uniref:GtrA family protein n=1 Tax=Roseateles asaccharophilus TaxID=582607 RepID=UPI003918C6AB
MTLLRQIARYGVVGLLSNGIGYGLYLLLTFLGLGPKLTMSLLYVVGVLQTFLFNKRWTFQHDGSLSVTFVRYLLVYALGYLVNLAALCVFVDYYGWVHQYVQGAMILILALGLFSAQKLWVFRSLDINHSKTREEAR